MTVGWWAFFARKSVHTPTTARNNGSDWHSWPRKGQKESQACCQSAATTLNTRPTVRFCVCVNIQEKSSTFSKPPCERTIINKYFNGTGLPCTLGYRCNGNPNIDRNVERQRKKSSSDMLGEKGGMRASLCCKYNKCSFVFAWFCLGSSTFPSIL